MQKGEPVPGEEGEPAPEEVTKEPSPEVPDEAPTVIADEPDSLSVPVSNDEDQVEEPGADAQSTAPAQPLDDTSVGEEPVGKEPAVKVEEPAPTEGSPVGNPEATSALSADSHQEATEEPAAGDQPSATRAVEQYSFLPIINLGPSDPSPQILSRRTVKKRASPTLRLPMLPSAQPMAMIQDSKGGWMRISTKMTKRNFEDFLLSRAWVQEPSKLKLNMVSQIFSLAHTPLEQMVFSNNTGIGRPAITSTSSTSLGPRPGVRVSPRRTFVNVPPPQSVKPRPPPKPLLSGQRPRTLRYTDVAHK